MYRYIIEVSSSAGISSAQVDAISGLEGIRFAGRFNAVEKGRPEENTAPESETVPVQDESPTTDEASPVMDPKETQEPETDEDALQPAA